MLKIRNLGDGAKLIKPTDLLDAHPQTQEDLLFLMYSYKELQHLEKKLNQTFEKVRLACFSLLFHSKSYLEELRSIQGKSRQKTH
jgi:hypothetical protein